METTIVFWGYDGGFIFLFLLEVSRKKGEIFRV